MIEPDRSIYFADFERWQDLIKARSAEVLEQKKRKDEKNLRREAAKAIEKDAATKNTLTKKPTEKPPEPNKAPSKSVEPIIERKSASSSSPKLALPTNKRVWCNPHSLRASTSSKP